MRTPGAKNKSKFIYVSLKALDECFKNRDMVIAISREYEAVFKNRLESVPESEEDEPAPAIKVTRAEDIEPEKPVFSVTK